MRALASVTDDVLIEVTPGAVWSVIADPAMHERLDARCRAESQAGAAGAVASSYVLAVRRGMVSGRFRYVIVESEHERRLVADVERAGTVIGQQLGQLVPGADGTTLRWTVTMNLGPLTRRAWAKSSRRELATWLEAVDREARASAG